MGADRTVASVLTAFRSFDQAHQVTEADGMASGEVEHPGVDETHRSPWRRFRRLPGAVQAATWVVATFLALGLIGSALGPAEATATRKPASNLTGAALEAGSAGAEGQPSEAVDADEAPEPGADQVAPAIPVAGAASSASAACRQDPLANVYHPDRLQVIDPCRTVTGQVDTIRHEDDGDYHINIRLDAAFAALINAKNVTGESGDLVVEVVPADEAGCTVGQAPRPATATYDYGECTGADITIPKAGDHVQVTGPYVIDHAHGWMEIHPAWEIKPVVLAPTSVTAPPAVAPVTAAPVTAPPVTAPPVTAPPVTAPPVTAAPVPTTAAPAASSGPTAQCADGTYSYSAHRSGTCSHHGGVAQWINPPPS